jgi:hypothetical protein
LKVIPGPLACSIGLCFSVLRRLAGASYPFNGEWMAREIREGVALYFPVFRNTFPDRREGFRGVAFPLEQGKGILIRLAAK